MPDAPPVVCLLLPEATAREMFRPADLDRLRVVAQVRGPVPAGMDDAGWRELARGALVLITGWGTPGPERLRPAELSGLGFIAHSAGTVKYLVDAAVYEAGVRVSNAADQNAIPVAHYTLGLMLMLLKQTPWIAAAYAANDEAEVRRRKALCRELIDLDVGLAGCGRIARELIRLLKGFPKLRVHVYDPYLSEARAAEVGVKRATLEEVCRCDVVSDHLPKLPETNDAFNADRLALLPDHAVFINTARGNSVNEAALVAECLRRPLYVALDVTQPEPPAVDSPLRTCPNLLLTPHIAGSLKQARLEMGEAAIQETLRFLAGEPLRQEVTRAMFDTEA
ncbi:MAG: hydroxyacid dehydrogenase [Phycisphaerae bacterium]